MSRPIFNRRPIYSYSVTDGSSWSAWPSIAERLLQAVEEKRNTGAVVVAVDCYHGVHEAEVIAELTGRLRPSATVRTSAAFKDQDAIRALVAPDLTDDPVFGRLTDLDLADYLDPDRLQSVRSRLDEVTGGTVLVVGPGASLIVQPDILVYADMARWEIQQRMRRFEISNLGVHNADEDASAKYKWGYFVDWRVLDRHKRGLFQEWDFLLDTNSARAPRLVTGPAYRRALAEISQRPFMLVPFFDPGPWGGHWMEEVCDLDRSAPNYAWCFNCVPEENSLLIRFGDVTIESPAINLVFLHPEDLLGREVHRRFGAEFPIRFDFLDTMGGGNLSLQVHPTSEYIREQFRVPYTQDESYYFMDAAPGARVFLGLKDGADVHRMRRELESAQKGDGAFDADEFAASFPIGKHDHVSIPAGTLHCSGRNSVVLEISATPYIFTFKLWDWGRLGLDEKPRPIHVERGMTVLASDRTESWVRQNLLPRVELVAHGDGWREERTGLHDLEFIETRRHWFKTAVRHNTGGTVNVLTLIEGQEATVESPDHAFDPFVVHYAETFVVPAVVGSYIIRPSGPTRSAECATIKAFVRDAAVDSLAPD